MFNFGRPNSPAQWILQIVLACVALFLVWFMIRAFVL